MLVDPGVYLQLRGFASWENDHFYPVLSQSFPQKHAFLNDEPKLWQGKKILWLPLKNGPNFIYTMVCIDEYTHVNTYIYIYVYVYYLYVL